MDIRLLCALVLSSLIVQAWSERSFTIDYADNCFKKNGECFRYISGSIHYFRIPSQYWRDRLMKMYMAGLNAVQVYIPWNMHEPLPGVFDFKGDRDLERFLDLTNEIGLLAIIRPGPYICAEWDMGGLPAWLLNKKDIALRTSDPDYLYAVDSWLSVLLPMLRTRLYINGGNIISVQVENEYGSFVACDYNYLRHLHIKFRGYLGDQVVLFTTDGNTEKDLKCGSLQGIYPTVDFGPVNNVSKAFEALRRLQPRGPLVNSEYYTGWLDYWGGKHANTSSVKVSQTLMDILQTGASVNMYMFAGGTNFGFWNGADYKQKYQPVTTSYDYDAPLTEAGDPTEKVEALRNVIRKFQPVPEGPIPPPTPKYYYGFVSLTKIGGILDLLDILSPGPPIVTRFPLTFEDLKQYFGFVMYRTQLKWDIPHPTILSASPNGIHDRAYILINGNYRGVLERDSVNEITVTGNAGDWLDLVVENMGRINYGADFNDFKGLVSNLTLGADILSDWTIYPLKLDEPIALGWLHAADLIHPKSESVMGPAIYSGTFRISVAGDTYLKLPKWTKGQVWINGFNLGRYWPARGPQITLYVPGNILSATTVNNITVFELEQAPDVPVVLLLDRPILDGLL